MNIDTLKSIKDLSSQALKGRIKLEKLANSYLSNKNNMTRAKTTSYNAKAAQIMEYEVEPIEKELKEVIGKI